MIDFASIKKTPCGRDCHYFGMRQGLTGIALHSFGVWDATSGTFEWCYDEQGRRLTYTNGNWFLHPTAEPIAPPPKRKVWAYCLRDRDGCIEELWLSDQGPDHHDEYDYCQEVEVP